MFAVRYFCGSFLHAKMAAWLNGDTKGFFFFSGGSIGCVRGLRQRVGFAEKRVWSWNMWANVLERVTRITKNDGDIEPTKLTGSV